MTSTGSQLQTEKEQKQIAKRQKSAARQIVRSARGGIALLAAIVLFIVRFGNSLSQETDLSRRNAPQWSQNFSPS
jgi:hypothetical protein